MQSEHRVVLTKIYVLLVNETPVEEAVDELGRKLNVQDNVYIQREKVWEPAIVVEKTDNARSYVVKTSDNKQFRRNRKHLMTNKNNVNINPDEI